MRIAVSGHRGLPAQTARLVDAALRAELAVHSHDLTGLSCLADGADHIFARAVVELGGRLEAVIPADFYRAGLPPAAHPEYDDLLSSADVVHRLPYPEPTDESYLAASTFMVDRSEVLLAIWDGEPSRGHGGTADVVAYARAQGKPVKVVWPAGAIR